jgi:hypothetical protein
LPVQVVPDEHLIGQLSILPQPSDFWPHSSLLHVAGMHTQ